MCTIHYLQQYKNVVVSQSQGQTRGVLADKIKNMKSLL